MRGSVGNGAVIVRPDMVASDTPWNRPFQTENLKDFVERFPLLVEREATLRFVEAAATLDGVRLSAAQRRTLELRLESLQTN